MIKPPIAANDRTPVPTAARREDSRLSPPRQLRLQRGFGTSRTLPKLLSTLAVK